MFSFISYAKNAICGSRNKEYIFAEMQIPPEGFFTQAELDQLKCIISECISQEETLREHEKESAQVASTEGTKEYWYKQMRKSNKRIKLLANLQRKIKHSLITMG
jgi:hypothetical protein